MAIKIGDIVAFKKVYRINIGDLISRQNYSKYMIVVGIYNHIKEKTALKVLCANGDINWVSSDRLEKICV